MALTADMRTEGGWLSWRPLTVAWRNCWMSSGDIAAVKRLAAHRARPRRNGDAAGQEKTRRDTAVKRRHTSETTDIICSRVLVSGELRQTMGLTCQVEISQDHTGQETVHVKLDSTVLHILCDDGFD